MNKAELIATVAEKTGLSKKDSEKAVNATFDTITQDQGRDRDPGDARARLQGRQGTQGRCFQIRTHKRSGLDPERFSQEDAYAPG